MDEQTNNFIVTNSAFNRIKELIKKKKNSVKALRVTVEAGGCSGFRYKYDMEENIDGSDIIIEQDGIKVVVDEISAPFLQNSKLDFIQELGGAYFQISNPNAISKCGCGSSFGI